MNWTISITRRLLRTPDNVGVKAHLAYIFWQKILGVNRGVPWPVHFTSRVVGHENITVGRGSYPGDMPGCYIQGINGITIGEGCEFGPGVGLVSANHDPMDFRKHMEDAPIKIGDHCWLGMRVIVLPGVILGPRTIVGAGSVVTTSFPDGQCVIAGNPARLIRHFESSKVENVGQEQSGSVSSRSGEEPDN